MRRVVLCSALACALGETVWYAEHGLSEAAQLDLTQRGCFRGSYGSLSLTTCESRTAAKIGTFADDLNVCVVQLQSANMLPVARHIVAISTLEPERGVEIYADETHMVLRNAKNQAELSASCDQFLFGVINGTVIVVPTYPIVPQKPMPWNHRAVQRVFNRTGNGKLAPDPLIKQLVDSYSANEVKKYVEWVSTDQDRKNTRITRNSYAIKPGVGGCVTGWRCANTVQDEMLAEIQDLMEEYPGDWLAEKRSFNAEMCPNIVVTLRGVIEPEQVVIIGAHLDSRNTGSGKTATGVAPGADDNGTGTAVVLAILRNIVAHGVEFHYTVLLMWFCGEEQGLIGSGDIAKKMQTAGDKVIGMFNNDMIGYTMASGTPTLSFMKNSATAWLSASCKEFSSTYIPSLAVGDTTACCSDQQSFFNNGFASAGIFETPTNSVQYPQYHRTGDTYDNNLINYDQVFRFGQANYACMLEYAIPQPPELLAKRF